MKSKKIRLFLSKSQEKQVEQWFGAARFCYNQTVAYLKQPGTKADWKAIKTEILHSLPDWCKAVPFQIKSIAIRDACIAVREAKKKFAKLGSFNEVGFKSRKNPSQSCYIPSSAISKSGIYKTILGEIHFNESLPIELMDSRLVRRYGRYYLTVPYESQRHVSENQARVVALDPGVRTFQTFVSENSVGKIGEAGNLAIQKLCFRLDDLISRTSKATGNQKKSMRKAQDRLRMEITNKIDELHHKTARFLVDNFDVILLPTFETSQMVTKANRRIKSKSVRQMMSFAHYRFKQFLKHKAFETGKMVIDVCEAYTSKTVSWTGEINHKLGGSKTVTSSDGRTMDRDFNGARGIFLRAVVDTPLLKNNLSNYFVNKS
jgi:putative transposase